MKQKPKKYLKPKRTKLNIGCGRKKFDGFVNIDIAKEVNPDVIVNIEEGFKSQGLKCFKEKHKDYIQVFFEEIITEDSAP